MTNRERAVVIELWSKYSESIYAYAWRLTKNKDHANDLVQTAFLEICNRVERREPASNWKAWLYGVVRNTYRNDCKARIRELPLEQLKMKVMPYEMAEPLVIPQKLPEIYREIIQLHVVEQLDYATIAEKLQITEAVARQRFSRAAKEYRKLAKHKT